jgi:DNA polymerase III alpha subunit
LGIGQSVDKKIKRVYIKYKTEISGTEFYLKVRSGELEANYLHPDLDTILSETNGVFVYQESVMKFLVEIVGYSWEEADQIRSAIAKKKRDVIVSVFDRIRAACSDRRWDRASIEIICQQILAFSSYGFNKSHARAYSELGYITMYLKHHYPLEWWTAELNNSDENKIRHYVTILGDKITPPSLHAPADRFTIVGNRIAAPMSAIKGLGPASIKAIINKGPYFSVEDFIGKMSGGITSSHFWALLKAGVFDEMASKNISMPEARVGFIDLLKKIKKVKTIPSEVSDNSPLNMFLNQRDTYKCFNKALLLDPLIRAEISAIWPSMRETKRNDIPFAFGTAPTIPVIASVAVAEKLLESQERSENTDRIKVAMIGLFHSSSHRSGISKRGKPWSKVDVILSDGISSIECVFWDQKKSLRYPVNSLVYVMGYIKRGWRGSATLDLLEIERLNKFDHLNKKLS